MVNSGNKIINIPIIQLRTLNNREVKELAPNLDPLRGCGIQKKAVWLQFMMHTG